MGLHPEGSGQGACKQGICRRDPYVPKRDCRHHKKNDDEGIVTAIQDESIVIAGSRARKRGCTRRRIRASYVYTGSHSKTDSVRIAYHRGQEDVQTIRQV